jgi:hypothetical protein
VANVTAAAWRKASYSGNGSQQNGCVEVAAWRKASYSGSGTQQNGCVEVARSLPGAVAVRDSKDPNGPVLTVEPAEWRNFITAVKAGEHDLA